MKPRKQTRSARRKSPQLLHTLRVHATLLLCAALGVALFFLLPGSWKFPARFVVAWDVGALVYLGSALTVFARFNLSRVKSRAADQDEGATVILMLTVLAVAVSLAAVINLLGEAKNIPAAKQHGTLALAVGTILISWLLIHTMFALHYAHEFYGGEDVGRGGGLKFPSEPQPDYWDFAYFSFVIGMTFQVSDVQVTGRQVRRLAVVHGIVSFFFSVTIIALMVNIGSSLI